VRFLSNGNVGDGEDRTPEASSDRGNGDSDGSPSLPGPPLADADCPAGEAIDVFLEEILKAFGGPRGLARQAFSEYGHAPTGGNTRRAFIDRVVVLLEAKNKADPPQEMDEIPLDELKEEARELLRESQD